MSNAKIAIIATFLTLGIYALLIVPFALWPFGQIFPAFLVISLYALLAFGLASELAEHILAFFLGRRRVALVDHVGQRESTAVVMTICNDAMEQALAQLPALSRAGYEVFILDDSDRPGSIPEGIGDWVTVVRRVGRNGAKGGNLNHWLFSYGRNYRNMIIMDSDSFMSISAIDDLLRAAQHADNEDVAIFQSKIMPHPNLDCSLFSKIIGISARTRARIMERVHSRLGILLSSGHNQLVRVDAVVEIGGFSEDFSAEDTVLSLDLSRRGWRTELIDVWTYDTEPKSVDAYIRRTTRWARQTVELFHGNWSDVSLPLKLLLCRHILLYILPIIGISLLIFSIFYDPQSRDVVSSFFEKSFSFSDGYFLYGFTIWVALAAFLLSIVFRFCLALIEGISFRWIVLSSIFGFAYCTVVIFPLAISIVASAVGFRTKFVSTNMRGLGDKDRPILGYILLRIQCLVLPIALIVAVALDPEIHLVGLNVVWFYAVVLTPLALVFLTHIQIHQKPNS